MAGGGALHLAPREYAEADVAMLIVPISASLLSILLLVLLLTNPFCTHSVVLISPFCPTVLPICPIGPFYRTLYGARIHEQTRRTDAPRC